MRRVLTVDEMSAADDAAVAMGLPSLLLMERAALSVVDVIDELEADRTNVLVICGTGNNGGDGAAAARLLAERGEPVEVFFPLGTEKASPQLKTQIRLLEHYGVPVVREYASGKYSLVIDALFGIGLKRDVTGAAAEVIRQVNSDRVEVLSVDIPSGIDGNTGAVRGIAVRADVTVTFAEAKRGHYFGAGKAYTGSLVIKKIGIPTDRISGQALLAVEDEDFEDLPERREDGNKSTFGKLLVVAGSREISGAAYLCAAAALRSGIGMVRIFTHERNRIAMSVLLPEALITTYDADSYETGLLKEALDWSDAAVVGPGLSTGELSKRLFTDFLSLNTGPAVFDADALNLLAAEPALWDAVNFPCVVTPHIGEMSRLTGLPAAGIKADPAGTASAFAGRRNAVCVLKDASTVTAYPDGRVYVNTSGCSALSTAGSGDVLAGLLGGFLLQYEESGLPIEAMAVYYHGCLGEAAAEEETEEAVTAGSLIEQMRAGAFRAE